VSEKKEFNPLDTRAQEAAIKKQAESRRLEQEQEVEDLKYLMGVPVFRRFVWRQLDKAGVFRTSFSTNGLEMAFKEGNRNLGVQLLAEINEHCPERYVQMTKEQKKSHEHRSGKR
jgi:hypothetical protein